MMHKQNSNQNHSSMEADVRRSSVKKMFLEIRKIRWKTPVPESFFNKIEGAACNFIKKETSA